MSYDIELRDEKTDKIVVLDLPFEFRGGTYAIGGTRLAEFNITYNYAPIFQRFFPEKGIRELYGKAAKDTRAMLRNAIDSLKDDPEPVDYWIATEGNAKIALMGLLTLATLAPDAVWYGD